MNPNNMSVSTTDMVLDHQELYAPLGDVLRKKVRETLLKQHHHQNQKKLANRLPIVRSLADMGRRASELHLDKNGKKTGQLQLEFSLKPVSVPFYSQLNSNAFLFFSCRKKK